VQLPAPTYIDYVMTWIQNLLDDETVFPTKSGMYHPPFHPDPCSHIVTGRDFPQSFPSTVKHVYRQLLRVFAHIYHQVRFGTFVVPFSDLGPSLLQHYSEILHLRSEPHFNSLFAHFLAFGREYELLEMKDLRGSTNSPVGIAALWDRWRDMGILEGSHADSKS